jgi:two-component system chemotaxis sensor kinase CheA
VAASAELYRLRNEYLPIVHLDRVFNIDSDAKPADQGLLVVVESQGRKIALKTDDLLAQQQVVVKSLEANFRSIRGLSGATILGDGTIALILDIAAVIEDSRAATPKNSLHPATSETKYEHVH